jgi:hypothetical protein
MTDTKKTRLEKLKHWFFIMFMMLLLIAAGLAVLAKDWFALFISIITMAMAFVPSAIEKRTNIDFPTLLEFGMVLFIFFSLYLGEIHSFYLKFWWWDLFLHGISGFILGAWGLVAITLLNKTKRLNLNLRPSITALIAFCFAMSVGTVWEIFEFSLDSLFGFNMQKSGLSDTMWDLIVDMLGALMVAILGYINLKRRPWIYKKFIDFLAS